MSVNEAFLCSEELSRIPACAKARSTALSISHWMRGSVTYKSSLKFTNLLTHLIMVISLTVHELLARNLTVTTLMGISVMQLSQHHGVRFILSNWCVEISKLINILNNE